MKKFHVASILIAVAIFAGSGCITGKKGQKQADSKSPCEIYYKSEGDRTTGYKTSSSVSFSGVSNGKVLAAATTVVTDSGYTILDSNKKTGGITAEYKSGDKVQAKLSIQVRKSGAGANIVIVITTPADSDIPVDCCAIIGKVEEQLGTKAVSPFALQEAVPDQQAGSGQPEKSSEDVVKAKKNCNVRPEPSTQKVPIGNLKAGETVKKIGQQDNWIKILLENGNEGWVREDLVEPVK